MDVNQFSAIQVGLASPEKILEWSYGEVTKPETINYRSQKPEKDGLFCEKIFGPSKDWECYCGKYKKVRFKGVVCDRCGVEITKSSVRRERMGHIKLAASVAHIWYLKGIPSKMGLVLDVKPKKLEEVIYFVSYIVVDPGDTPLQKKQILSERDYRELKGEYGNRFDAATGAEAIKRLLAAINLPLEIEEVRKELKESQGGQQRTRLMKKLETLDAFASSNNRPEWMIMDVLPVIPPDLRPMLQLDGGRFATSDLNDLYRRVITRNNRLKKLLEMKTPPAIIVQNEKRMLQEAVDALIDNGKRSKPITGAGGRPLKSLSHTLKGKQGRFRQNLLGKRVDYSGRSVIAVGPDLKMYQCGLPKEMAIELFKPFIIAELVEQEITPNIKSAEKLIDKMDESVWPVVEQIIKNHPVLLNRAPTLHRLGIQAFEPKLVEGRAIRLHPLVTPAFNADFDGDQMAVHIPLSLEARAEARQMMLGSNNILGPKDGKPIVTPSQDMVLGNYYLTQEKVGVKGEGKAYKNINEAIMAMENNVLDLHARIAIKASTLHKTSFTEEQNKGYLITTLGKLIFNEIFDKSFPFLNEQTLENLEVIPTKYFVPMGTDIKEYVVTLDKNQPFKKKYLGQIIAEVFKRYKTLETSRMLDEMKNLGFSYSTKAGVTVSIADIEVSDHKYALIEEAEGHAIPKVENWYRKGLITDPERHAKVIAIWTDVRRKVEAELAGILDEDNPINMMMDSGARGNISNFLQLSGMRGLMAKPNGETIEIPVIHSFREGLTVSEFFTSTHGARKGLADTALKTANSGYLTRRLVDVAQDVIVQEEDCHTDTGFTVKTIMDIKANTVIEPLFDRLVGRYSKNTILHPETNELIVAENETITEDIAKNIVDAGIEEVEIRSIFGCKSKNGVCKKCYGRNLATGLDVEVGESVGIMAAQSIGEPGTQLTMRTFHTGGVATDDDITQGLPRIAQLFEARAPKVEANISEIEGTVESIEQLNSRYIVKINNPLEAAPKEYVTQYSAVLRVGIGDTVKAGDKITEGVINPKRLLNYTGVKNVQNYILKEVQKVYRLQGIEISDKHIEVVIRQMLRKLKIVDGGHTPLLPGTLVSVNEFTDINHDVLLAGGNPAVAQPALLGITKASLETESFLSAASFQETTKVLTDAAIKGKTDELIGLKENVIIGKLIPAGTGLNKDHKVFDGLYPEPEEVEDDVISKSIIPSTIESVVAQ
ncbi:DNA-directed RNA polymerase subunit beta' [Mycoplasma sp. P36-A1]|uniref:DNA-directed RNA polymerase subunit beta' n=1 Tax=Mycoplasma sp. P36-A1 TaxID=3252900 RepID=UPI003C2B0774